MRKVMKRSGFSLLVGGMVILGLPQAGGAQGQIDVAGRGMAGKRSVSGASLIERPRGNRSNLECVANSGGANTRLDCDDPFPNNEPQIAVDPTNPLHMVAGSNDSGSCCDQFYTTFDGGGTWSTGNMSKEANDRIGSDPVTSFDARTGNVLHASLNFTVFHSAGTQACDGDAVVSVSTDGGLSWAKPVMVADGVGCDLSKRQMFSDKEWIVSDNNPASPFYGRTYLTWSGFLSSYGSYISSAIYEAHSDDGGKTWSSPHVISGSNPSICTYQIAGPAGECDEDQASVPVVQPDGTVLVAFINEQNQALWDSALEFDSQYLVVKSDDGGVTWSAPRFVVGMEDGFADYPLNVWGGQMLTAYQVRIWAPGNIATDPRTGQLYLVFSDNRNGIHDSATPVTNNDVFITTSADDGVTWSAPTQVDSSATDQWFPWADVNPVDGTVGVIYNDQASGDPALYNATFAKGSPGSFSSTVVSTAASHPDDSDFFQAGVPGCELCAAFHGDYLGLAYGRDGVANLVWTDMRDQDLSVGTGYQMFIYYARVP